jgi:hypothetical protein
MVHILRAIIVFSMFFSFAQAQQKEHSISTDVKVPDSLISHSDSLRVKDVSQKEFRQGWAKLKKDMPASEVRILLGLASREEYSAFDASDTWHYGKRVVVIDHIKQTLRYWKK